MPNTSPNDENNGTFFSIRQWIGHRLSGLSDHQKTAVNVSAKTAGTSLAISLPTTWITVALTASQEGVRVGQGGRLAFARHLVGSYQRALGPAVIAGQQRGAASVTSAQVKSRVTTEIEPEIEVNGERKLVRRYQTQGLSPLQVKWVLAVGGSQFEVLSSAAMNAKMKIQSGKKVQYIPTSPFIYQQGAFNTYRQNMRAFMHGGEFLPYRSLYKFSPTALYNLTRLTFAGYGLRSGAALVNFGSLLVMTDYVRAMIPMKDGTKKDIAVGLATGATAAAINHPINSALDEVLRRAAIVKKTANNPLHERRIQPYSSFRFFKGLKTTVTRRGGLVQAAGQFAAKTWPQMLLRMTNTPLVFSLILVMDRLLGDEPIVKANADTAKPQP